MMEKKEWIANQNAEKKNLENKLHNFLTDAIQNKAKMDELTAHYRISGLYNYSFYNSMMIMIQGGTIAQSFNKWKKIKRNVKKGEKGTISIFIPMIKKEPDSGESKCFGFKLGKVFDITQTEGEPLKYDHNSLDNANISFETICDCVKSLTDSEIIVEHTGNARGWSNGNKIAVSDMSNNTDQIKTLFHEVAHDLIHTGKDAESKISRSAMEIEAESIAYLTLSYLGINYDLSSDYVNNWKSGMSEIRSGLIVKTADKIIKAIRAKLANDTTNETEDQE